MKRIIVASIVIAGVVAIPGVAQASSSAVTVAAVGDIACEPGAAVTATTCHQASVASAITASKPKSLWLLGDIQYLQGELGGFQQSFGPAFSAFSKIWRPAPGNHEYYTPGASGYYDFFGKAAGPSRRGYYSFDIGKWHVVSLNSNCDVIDCTTSGAELKWLKADLAKHKNRCTAAYWHHPYFSSGEHGNNSWDRPMWQALRNAHADLVLSGHDHDFEAFPRMSASGGLDSKHGLASFVVGMGGKSLYPFSAVVPHSAVRIADQFGFLELKLSADRYTWRYLTENRKSLASGKARCR